MEQSSYALEMNHIVWDPNALNEFVESSADKWSDTNVGVMPYIKLSGYEAPVLEILKQLSLDFSMSIEESYIVRLKSNSVLGKHTDNPRKASFNFPLTENISSCFVKFYGSIDAPSNVDENVYLYQMNETPVLFNVRVEHSFHNPTDSDVILLNLSTSDDWDRVKEIIESKRM